MAHHVRWFARDKASAVTSRDLVGFRLTVSPIRSPPPFGLYHLWCPFAKGYRDSRAESFSLYRHPAGALAVCLITPVSLSLPLSPPSSRGTHVHDGCESLVCGALSVQPRRASVHVRARHQMGRRTRAAAAAAASAVRVGGQ